MRKTQRSRQMHFCVGKKKEELDAIFRKYSHFNQMLYYIPVVNKDEQIMQVIDYMRKMIHYSPNTVNYDIWCTIVHAYNRMFVKPKKLKDHESIKKQLALQA